MPSLEIPPDLRDSSPDSSISADLAPDAPNPTPPPPPPPHPNPTAPHAARIQIHVQPPAELPALRRRRQHSFDRDLPELEEDNHWPGRAYLLPVVLPPTTEPTLDELLRRVTGRTDLQDVDSVKLRVISHMVSLSRLSLFLPRLARLDLSGSVLHSLRDLGCGLVHLVHLDVSNCGLSSFDGTSGLPSVRVLVADGNMVQLVGPLSDLPLLRRLSARHNRIADLGTLSFLGLCPNLAELELEGNPVTRLILYRLTLQRCVPSLELLDGEPLASTEAAAPTAGPRQPTSSASPSSSSSSSLSLSLSSEMASEASADPGAPPQRPATSDAVAGGSGGRAQPQPRPASSSVVDATARRRSLSLAGSPVVGSVLDVARQRRRHAWGVSSSGSGSSSGSASSLSSLSASASASSSAASSPARSGARRRHLPPLDGRRRRPQAAGGDSELSSLEENVSN